MGTLYVVATPIGNLEDLSDRARRVLNEVALIASEDTRHTGLLLQRLGITCPQLSLHAFNEASRVSQLLEALSSGDVALVSDAGTPGISDPGAMLVHEAAEAGFAVVPVPGPSALSAAMSISGFPASDVLFTGFLPRKAGERATRLRHALALGVAVYFFEAPGRVVSTLRELAEIDPDRIVIVCRELTKLHEEIVRGSAACVAADFASRERIRGEFVIGVGPARPIDPDEQIDIDALIDRELATGEKDSAIAKRLSALTGRPRSQVYDLVRERKSATR
ncbi:MAG: 16S rRNA (cytidine(1402)-2'-O)-methyltransferase [Thermomicrobiales bacterium]|nr:16S rRNA (cytidine(1402)-2'-O)-methyltransferase [Thermomicrobiales bacterium]